MFHGYGYLLPNSFTCHLYALQLAILLVIKAVDAHRTSEAASVRIDATIVIDEVPFALELHDGMVVGVAIARNFVQDSFVLPRAIDALAHGVSRLFRETDREGQVVPSLVLVNPRCTVLR